MLAYYNTMQSMEGKGEEEGRNFSHECIYEGVV